MSKSNVHPCDLCKKTSRSFNSPKDLKLITDVLREVFNKQIPVDSDASFCICRSCIKSIVQLHEFYEKIRDGLANLQTYCPKVEIEPNDEEAVVIKPEACTAFELFEMSVTTGCMEEFKEGADLDVPLDSDNDVDDRDYENQTHGGNFESEQNDFKVKRDAGDSSVKHINSDTIENVASESKQDETLSSKPNKRSKQETNNDTDAPPLPKIFKSGKQEASTDTSQSKDLKSEAPNIKPGRLSPIKDLETRLNLIKSTPNLPLYERRRQFYEFICFKCGLKFDEEWYLEKHLLALHNVPQIFYNCCNRTLKRSLHDKHVRFHLSAEDNVCPACPGKIMRRLPYQRHIKTCKRTVTCTECEKKFKPVDYIKHVEKNHPKVSVIMSEVTEPCISVNQQPKSDTNQSPPIWICDLCGREYNTKRKITEHFNQKHLKKHQIICEQCGQVASTRQALEAHIAYKHSENKELESCPVCHKRVKKVKQHYMFHHDNSDPQVCNLCGAAFGNKRQLMDHNIKKHDERKRHVCKTCGHSYKQKFELQEHEYTHLDIYKYSCKFCSFQVNYKKNLRSHMKTHHTEQYQAMGIERLKKIYGPDLVPKTIEGNKWLQNAKYLHNLQQVASVASDLIQ